MTDYYNLNIKKRGWDEILTSFVVEAQKRNLLDESIDPQAVVNQKEYIDNLLIMDYAVFSQVLSETYEMIEAVYNSMRLRTATGEDLDNIGQMFLSRYAPQKSVGVIRVGFEEELEEPMQIPMGLRFTSQYHDLVFITRVDKLMEAGDKTAEIPIIADDVGSSYNVPAGYITDCLDHYGFDYISNPDATYGGYDGESDESYRERLLNWKYILNRGTLSAYVDFLNGLKEVRGYHIEPYWDGPGTVLITIDPPVDEIVADVEVGIETIKAVDEYVVVEKVKPVSMDLSVQIEMDYEYPAYTESTAIKKRVEDLLEVYFDGGELPDGGGYYEGMKIGQDFIPFRAAAFLSDYLPDVGTISFKYPSSRVVILPDERATLGTVTVEVTG